MLNNTSVKEGQVSPAGAEACWYALTSYTARFFRVGETLEQGTYLGESPYGSTPLWTTAAVKVDGVQFDLSSEMVFVALVSQSAAKSCLQPC